MSADRDSRLPPGPEDEDGFEDEETPRSIFGVTWFRVVLVLVAIAIVGALAVPYVLDAVNPPTTPLIASTPRPGAPPATTPTPAPAPSTPSSSQTPAAPTTPAPTATPTPPKSQETTAAPSTSTPPSAPGPAKREPTTTTTPSTPKPSTDAAKSTTATKDPAPKATKEGETKSAPKQATPPDPKQLAQADRTPPSATKDAGAPTRSVPPRTPAPAAEGGDYFVQVGAFKDQAVASRVADGLRAQNFPAEVVVKRVGSGAPAADASRPAPRPATGGPDRYDVIVTGGTPAEINTKLAAKGLAAEPTSEGVRIRPSLPLRDAVALSKDLNNDGFKVQVRRGGTPAPGASAPAPSRPSTASDADAGGETWYRVRVGGLPDRAAAQTAMRTLQGKGYQTFIGKGRD